MLIRNSLPAYRTALAQDDSAALGPEAAEEVMGFLRTRDGYAPTPLVALDDLAARLGIGAIHVKDEGARLGLGSFKALGGAYAVIRLAVEEASKRAGRTLPIAEWRSPEVAMAASAMTVACATDGNHGRSVAQGAQLLGIDCVIFVHSGVSEERANAIARFGARIVRVDGNYDESVAVASRVAQEKGWIIVSDTSWPGYERIPHLVMQGYTAMLQESLAQLPEPPTHVFIQSGVGGVAAAVAAHFAILLGDRRPIVTVVDPDRAACIVASAQAGRAVAVQHGRSTVMAMLECYEPSLVAWRILSRCADFFMTVDDDEAISTMRLLADPAGADAAIVAGESGGVGLAGLLHVAADPALRQTIGLTTESRVFVINTEGATDPQLYEQLVGKRAEDVAARPGVSHDAEVERP